MSDGESGCLSPMTCLTLYRDREHTTVLVSGIAKSTSKDLVESFFESVSGLMSRYEFESDTHQCGKIREITLKSDSAWPTSAALLEFQTVDSVSAALAKDRRKIDDQEISVSMLWRSTLFVTNFPPETDDRQIRDLFGNVSLTCMSGSAEQLVWDDTRYSLAQSKVCR